jgi:hypothetical protein
MHGMVIPPPPLNVRKVFEIFDLGPDFGSGYFCKVLKMTGFWWCFSAKSSIDLVYEAKEKARRYFSGPCFYFYYRKLGGINRQLSRGELVVYFVRVAGNFGVGWGLTG